MTTSHTLTGSLANVLGEGAHAVIATLDTNLGRDALADRDGKILRLPGPSRLPLDNELAFSQELIATNSTGMNVAPGTLRYLVHVKYRDAHGGERDWDSGYFPLTTDLDLVDAVSGAFLPPTYVSDAIEQLEAIKGEVQTLKDQATAVVVGDLPAALDGLGLPVDGAALTDHIATEAPPRKAGPRGLPRVKHGLLPTLAIDSHHPRPEVGDTRKILSAGGARWWAYTQDCVLQQSTSEGRDWTTFFEAGYTGQMGRDGLFFEASDGTLFTTWHPFDNSTPALWRSTPAAAGTMWTASIPPTAGVGFLGPTSICESPTTGRLFVGEYVVGSTSTYPVFHIKVSDDSGATWTTWKTVDRTRAVHCHGIQVDPFTGRLWACVGDAGPDAGLYLINEDEDDWTPVATNAMLDTDAGIWGGAVSLLFFPTHIAWGVDQAFDSGLVRMPRSEIGQLRPDVEFVTHLNSTAFYACRTDDTTTEWVLSASQEGGAAAIDNAIHFYRVADNGATIDEIGSIPAHLPGPSFHWAFPLGTPTQDNASGLMWWGTNIYPGQTNSGPLEIVGSQFSARVGWTNQSMERPRASLIASPVMSQSSGLISMGAWGDYKDFGALVVPPKVSTLYITEMVCFTSDPASDLAAYPPKVEIWTESPWAVATFDWAGPASFGGTSLRRDKRASTLPYVHKISGLTPGAPLFLRLHNPGPAIALSGTVSYAWGY